MKQAIETQPLIRELKQLIEGITSDLKNSFAKCIKAGELLTKIKSNTKHGDWEDVLQAVGVTFKTAKRYMVVWERRSELNLSEIKTLSDAENVFAKIGRLPIATSQNEVLTHEKNTTDGQSDSRLFDLHSTWSSNSANTVKGSNREAKAIAQGDKRDYSGVYTSSRPEPKESEVRLDKVGRPIPEGILSEWDRAHDTGTKLRSMVSEVKCTLQKALEAEKESDRDVVFRELTNSVISEAEALHYSLSQILPYAVCPKCQGKTHKTCLMCRQRGFVSKFYWDSPTVGTDLRNVIRKQYANSQTLSA